jgi:hypothetical protein
MRIVGLLLISAADDRANAVAQQLARSFPRQPACRRLGVLVSVPARRPTTGQRPSGGTIVQLAIAVFVVAAARRPPPSGRPLPAHHSPTEHRHEHGAAAARGGAHGDHVRLRARRGTGTRPRRPLRRPLTRRCRETMTPQRRDPAAHRGHGRLGDVDSFVSAQELHARLRMAGTPSAWPRSTGRCSSWPRTARSTSCAPATARPIYRRLQQRVTTTTWSAEVPATVEVDSAVVEQWARRIARRTASRRRARGRGVRHLGCATARLRRPPTGGCAMCPSGGITCWVSVAAGGDAAAWRGRASTAPRSDASDGRTPRSPPQRQPVDVRPEDVEKTISA